MRRELHAREIDLARHSETLLRARFIELSQRAAEMV
jgi:hypothetical protein